MITRIRKYNNSEFYYRTVRLALLDKFRLDNTFSQPHVNSIILSIDLKNLDTFDSSRLLASVFILQLLGKQKPYVVRFGLFQTFKEKDYDAFVVLTLTGPKALDFLELFGQEILPFTSRVDVKVNKKLSKNGVAVKFTVLNLSCIRIVETHSVFFRWHDRLRINLDLRASNKVAVIEDFLRLLRVF